MKDESGAQALGWQAGAVGLKLEGGLRNLVESYLREHGSAAGG